MKKNKVLITGGAGFIGSHLSEKLVLDDFDVTVIDNLYTGSISNINHLNDFNMVESNFKINSILCGGFSLNSFDLLKEAFSNENLKSIAFTNIFHYKEIPTYLIKENKMFTNLRRVFC